MLYVMWWIQYYKNCAQYGILTMTDNYIFIVLNLTYIERMLHWIPNGPLKWIYHVLWAHVLQQQILIHNSTISTITITEVHMAQMMLNIDSCIASGRQGLKENCLSTEIIYRQHCLLIHLRLLLGICSWIFTCQMTSFCPFNVLHKGRWLCSNKTFLYKLESTLLK